MLKKTCPYCHHASYSSSTLGEAWVCPKCMKDISHVEAEAPEPSAENETVPQHKSWLQSVRDFFGR